MDIEIDRIAVHLNGDMTAHQVRNIADSIGEALQTTLRAHAAELAASPAGYRIPSISLPMLRVSSNAKEEEITELVAESFGRSLLNHT